MKNVGSIPNPTSEDLKLNSDDAYDGEIVGNLRPWIRRAEHERKRADAAERERDEARKLLERVRRGELTLLDCRRQLLADIDAFLKGTS